MTNLSERNEDSYNIQFRPPNFTNKQQGQQHNNLQLHKQAFSPYMKDSAEQRNRYMTTPMSQANDFANSKLELFSNPGDKIEEHSQRGIDSSLNNIGQPSLHE